MEEVGMGQVGKGVSLGKWTDWMAMDMAADLAWSEKMHQMRDSKIPLTTHRVAEPWVY
jgi:hypothetical protein